MPSPIAAAARPLQPVGRRRRRIETNQCAVGPATSTVMARPPRRRGLDRERHLADDAAAADHMVTGALAQIGPDLPTALRRRYGAEHIIASDLRTIPPQAAPAEGHYEHVDCTQPQQLLDVLRRHEVSTIYHLAALLSA